MSELIDLRPGGKQIVVPIAAGRSVGHTFPESYDMTGPWTAKVVDRITAAALASPIVSPGVAVVDQTVTVTVSAANAATIGLHTRYLVLAQGGVPLIAHTIRISDRSGEPSDDEVTVLAANEVSVTVNVFGVGAGIPEGGTEGQVLAKASDDDFDAEWVDLVSDHGELTGLADDDHPQYALADGTRGDFDEVGAAADVAGDLATHEAATTNVHGIADSAALIVEGDSRLTDARTPTAHAASHKGGGSDAIAVAVASGAAGLLSGSDKAKLDGIEAGATADQTPAELLTAIETVDGTGSGLDADLLDGQHGTAFQTRSEKGSANGYAELDGTGKVPAAQLPAFVDDVIEAANFAALPGTGETGKIYVTLNDNLTYRWSGSAYVEISASLALGETSTTAYRGDRGKTAYDHSQLTSGNPHSVTKGDVGLGNVDNTSDANKPVSTAQQAAIDGKVSDTAYDATSWDAVTTVAPSKNAVRDEVEVLVTSIAAKVAKSLYDANSLLIADTDDTPTALVMGASTILARLASGGIVAATPSQLKTLLAIASGDVSDFTEATQDVVGALVAAGAGVKATYNDAGNTETISAPGAALYLAATCI